jgi:pyruvyltransferase
MYNFILNSARKLKFQYSKMDLEKDSIKMFWYKGRSNFGDYLNRDLVGNLSKVDIDWVPTNYNENYFMVIGSVLQLATDKSIVWGSGLIDDRRLPIKPPKKILAVRGPLTRSRLQKSGIKCPDVYGDPALIMPEVYHPKIEKVYDLGIIPHYADKSNRFFFQQFNSNVKIIDVEQLDFQQFINEVLSCRKIISSSLHGIIIADAYDVPVLRAEFSNKIFGGDFKFNDYFLSIDREIQKSILIDEKTTIDEILRLNFIYKKHIDISKLLEVSPFN